MGTHSLWLVRWYYLTGTRDQNIGPIAFLVDDTGKLALVIRPWSGWLPREALSTTESRVLQGSCQLPKPQLHLRMRLYLDND